MQGLQRPPWERLMGSFREYHDDKLGDWDILRRSIACLVRLGIVDDVSVEEVVMKQFDVGEYKEIENAHL